MGFRNLECFNKALLTKHAWRLVTSPELLLSRILKARYYPRETFFTAAVGDRPSTTWRGILTVRGCLSRGLHRHIGNGLDTAIWGDSWLSSAPKGRVLTTRSPQLIFPDRVADLIDWETYSWNYDLISSTFWPVDVHQILRVPFGSPATAEKLVWAFSKTGMFTVRSCYHSILEERQLEAEGGGSLDGDSHFRWEWIWSLKVPPKIRTFLWRACLDILLPELPWYGGKLGRPRSANSVKQLLKQKLIYSLSARCLLLFGRNHHSLLATKSKLPIL